jgi:hypothetical protein
MQILDFFLLDLWRLGLVTTQRPDVFMTSFKRDPHLESCSEAYLVQGERQSRGGKIFIEASVMCGHGSSAELEFQANPDLWILRS